MERTGRKQIYLSIQKDEYKSECDSGVFSNTFEFKAEQNPSFILMDLMIFLCVNAERQLHPRKKIFLVPHPCWNDPRNHWLVAMDPGLKQKVIQSRDRNPAYFQKFLFCDAKVYEKQTSYLAATSQHFTMNCNFLGKIPCSDYQAAGKKSSSYMPLVLFYLRQKQDGKWYVCKQDISFKMSSTNKEIDEGMPQLFEKQPISVPKEYLEALKTDNGDASQDITEEFETSQDNNPVPVTTFCGPFNSMDEAKSAFVAKRLEFLADIEKFQAANQKELDTMRENYNKRPAFWQHWTFSGNKHKRKREDFEVSPTTATGSATILTSNSDSSSSSPTSAETRMNATSVGKQQNKINSPYESAPKRRSVSKEGIVGNKVPQTMTPQTMTQQLLQAANFDASPAMLDNVFYDDNSVFFNDTLLMEIPPEKMLRFETFTYENYIQNSLLSNFKAPAKPLGTLSSLSTTKPLQVQTAPKAAVSFPPQFQIEIPPPQQQVQAKLLNKPNKVNININISTGQPNKQGAMQQSIPFTFATTPVDSSLYLEKKNNSGFF